MTQITYSDTRRTERATVLNHGGHSWGEALTERRVTSGRPVTDLTFETTADDLADLIPVRIFRDE